MQLLQVEGLEKPVDEVTRMGQKADQISEGGRETSQKEQCQVQVSAPGRDLFGGQGKIAKDAAHQIEVFVSPINAAAEHADTESGHFGGNHDDRQHKKQSHGDLRYTDELALPVDRPLEHRNAQAQQDHGQAHGRAAGHERHHRGKVPAQQHQRIMPSEQQRGNQGEPQQAVNGH